MSASSHARWPRLATTGVFLTLVAVYLWVSVRQNGGQFVYAQDDPYIHLALARTLAADGVWGLQRDQFAAASSSPLWTALLAAMAKVGLTAAWWPFALNVAAGLLVIWTFDRALRSTVPQRPRFAALVAALLVLPLPTLAFIGMEHTLHVAVVIALCTGAATRLAGGAPDRPWPAGVGLAALATGIRYEGLFVVAVVVAACLWQRARKTAIALAIAASVFPLAYAAYAVSHGGLPLPNSVLMKSVPARFGSLGGFMGIVGDWVGVLMLYQRPALAALTLMALLLAAALTVSRTRSGDPASAGPSPRSDSVALISIGLFLGVALLHVCLVKMEWFFRYEAYVIALGLVAVTLGMCEIVRTFRTPAMLHVPPLGRRALMACGIVLALPLVTRAAEGALLTVPATGEVYRQQYQMGLFFRDYYQGDAVALNDIGAVSWLAPVTVVDLIGLATPEVADARRNDADDTAFLDALLRRRGARAACVYEYYFSGRRSLPSAWQKVGEWSIGRSVAVSRETVAFYAPSDADALRLRQALDRFSPRLPRGAAYRPWP